MRRYSLFTIVTAIVLPCFFPACVAAQKEELSAQDQRDVVEALIKAIDELYLYQDRVPELSKQLRDKFDSGTYAESKSHFAFAGKLSDDLRAMTNDLHFAIRHNPDGGSGLAGLRLGGGQRVRSSGTGAKTPSAGTPQRRTMRIGSGSAPLDPESPLYKALHEQFRKNNFSMPKLEVLPGNVGYFRLDMMPPLDVARPTLDAAMAFLSNTDALIIDLRDTPGGVGGFIPYLMSYFFPEGGKLLYTRYFGAEDRADRFETFAEVGGKRRPDLPLYVLTSSSTGSAAENLAFTLKNHGRAQTVGETTRGGGHSATMASLGHGFTATIPIADVIHPVTKKGFDGVGVTPSIEVAASDALDKAQETALQRLLESATGKDKADLEVALAELRASREFSKSIQSNGEAFKEFTGRYGPRTIFVENEKLRYQRDGGPAVDLIPLGDDTFRLKAPPSVRTSFALPNLRFERDDAKQVRGLSLVRDGKVEEYSKKESP